jgi:hypothetical protein
MTARSCERSNHALTASLAASKLAMPARSRSPALIEVAGQASLWLRDCFCSTGPFLGPRSACHRVPLVAAFVMPSFVAQRPRHGFAESLRVEAPVRRPAAQRVIELVRRRKCTLRWHDPAQCL